MKIILLLLSLGLLMAFSSCQKEDDIKDNTSDDNYYVRYEITGDGPYGYFSNWSVTTPGSMYTKSGYQTRSWSQTYGPVSKGFTCSVSVESGSPTIKILISKNDEPFALKVSTTGSSASYTVK